MTDVERDKDQDALNRTAIHAEEFGYAGDFVFGADASSNKGPLPPRNIDGLRGRGKEQGYGVRGWSEHADQDYPDYGGSGILGFTGLAGIIGSGYVNITDPDKPDVDAAAGVIGVSFSRKGVWGYSKTIQIKSPNGNNEVPNDSGFGVIGTGPRAGVWGSAIKNNNSAVVPGGHGVRGDDGQEEQVKIKAGVGVFGKSVRGTGVLGRTSIPESNDFFDLHYNVDLKLKFPPLCTDDNPLLDFESDTRIRAGVAGIVGSQKPENNSNLQGLFPKNSVGIYGEAPLGEYFNSDGVKFNGFLGLAGLFYGPTWVFGNFYVSCNFQLSGSSVVYGNSFVIGNYYVFGAKSAVVPHPDGSHRALYCLESPESWFEDFGEATLVKGKAEVALDPDFAAVVDTEQYHVFLTPYGNCKGLYVSRRGNTSFEVREQGCFSWLRTLSANNLRFSYKVVAKRKDIQSERFATISVPEPINFQ